MNRRRDGVEDEVPGMMTEVCQYLKNWFDKGQPKFNGTFVISDGGIASKDGWSVDIKEGQYVRIIGSALNDGVWKIPEDEDADRKLRDEEFMGAVWLLAIPPAVVAVAKDITDWNKLYGGVDGQNMGPYSSESFGGYSYSKQQGGTSSNGSIVNGWIAMFGNRLSMWKKL